MPVVVSPYTTLSTRVVEDSLLASTSASAASLVLPYTPLFLSLVEIVLATTILATPADSHAARSARVPSTFTASLSGSSALRAARCTTASAPVHSVRKNSPSRTSPTAHARCACGYEIELARCTSALTSWPCSKSSATAAWPTSPPAPVTTTLMALGRS